MNAVMRKHINLIEWAETAAKTEWESLVNWDGKPAWHILPQSVRERLKANFPHMEDLKRLLCPDADRMTVHYETDTLVFEVPDSTEETLGFLKQTWRYEIDEIFFDAVRIDSGQGMELGFIRRLVRGSLRAYRLLGVTTIRCDAANMGSHLWARAGFLPDPYFEGVDDLDMDVMGRARQLGIKLPPELRPQDEGDLQFVWRVADHPRGQELLWDAQWHGYLDLNSKEQMARFFGRK